MSKRHRHATPCPTATKASYSTQEFAEAALASLQDVPTFELDGPRPRRVYRCACGRWHMTSRSESYAAIGERIKAADETARAYGHVVTRDARITDVQP